MLIRDAQADDFGAIAEITNHYIVNTPIHFGYDPVTPDELRTLWRKNTPAYPFFVGADDQARVVGYAKAGVWRERAAYNRTAEVGIYIRNGLHGRGLGKALYTRLIDACRTLGYHTLVGGVTLPNPASARLHESCGFIYVGAFREVGRKFDRWHDVGWWQLML